jgi:transcriptional regulator with XRE-family HTH domain
MNGYMPTIGHVIRTRLAELGWNQSKLAQVMCKSPAYISIVVAGKRVPHDTFFADMATALAMDPAILLSVAGFQRDERKLNRLSTQKDT